MTRGHDSEHVGVRAIARELEMSALSTKVNQFLLGLLLRLALLLALIVIWRQVSSEDPRHAAMPRN